MPTHAVQPVRPSTPRAARVGMPGIFANRLQRQRRSVRRHRPLLPAQQARNELPLTVVRVLRGHDAADAAAAHYLADADRRHIARGVAQPAAHRGIKREPLRAHEHLTIHDPRDGLLDELERPRPDPPTRALTQHKASIALAHTASIALSTVNGTRLFLVVAIRPARSPGTAPRARESTPLQSATCPAACASRRPPARRRAHMALPGSTSCRARPACTYHAAAPFTLSRCSSHST